MKIATKNEVQIDLCGRPQIKKKFKLNDNHNCLLGIIYLNPNLKITRNLLNKINPKKMHINTIANFLKEAEENGFIQKLRIIPGAEINTLFIYQKNPDTFEDGTICKDKRATYYQITEFGKQVYKLNEQAKQW